MPYNNKGKGENMKSRAIVRFLSQLVSVAVTTQAFAPTIPKLALVLYTPVVILRLPQTGPRIPIATKITGTRKA